MSSLRFHRQADVHHTVTTSRVLKVQVDDGERVTYEEPTDEDLTAFGLTEEGRNLELEELRDLERGCRHWYAKETEEMRAHPAGPRAWDWRSPAIAIVDALSRIDKRRGGAEK